MNSDIDACLKAFRRIGIYNRRLEETWHILRKISARMRRHRLYHEARLGVLHRMVRP